MGPDVIILAFWMLSFKPTFSLSFFSFIKMLFSSSSLSAIRVVSPVYLRLLLFLLAILILACASSSPLFLMTYSAYKLNKQGDNIQPWRTLFPIWNQSVAEACPTLSDPIDRSPPDYPVPAILQARTLEWVAISFSNAWKWKVKVKSLSRVPLLATPGTTAYQAAPSMGFSRQEYWSGVPLPSLKCVCVSLNDYENGYCKWLQHSTHYCMVRKKTHFSYWIFEMITSDIFQKKWHFRVNRIHFVKIWDD